MTKHDNEKDFQTTDTQQTLAEPSLLSGPAHTLDVGRVCKELEVDITAGLSAAECAKRHAEHGDNILNPPPKPNPWKLLGRQTLNAMTLILLAAMAVSFGTQSYVEAGVIALLVVLNVSVGFSQEWKAEKVMAALSSVGAPTAIVLRHEGNSKHAKEIPISVEEVVPGDIVILTPGTIVPADARVIEVAQLETDEALLTGESLPVAKSPTTLATHDLPLGARVNMVYAGSQVAKGRGRVVVVETGMNTELGKIAIAIERDVGSGKTGWSDRWYRIKVALGVAGTTPLQMKLNKLAYFFLGCACVLAVVVVASTAFRDIDKSIATYAVATAVSILPASLIAVVSLTLATASRELAKRNALVRRMDAIEGLSIVTDICSDKTGTLTVGKMVLKKVWIPARASTTSSQTYEVETSSDPYFPRGTIKAISTGSTLDTTAAPDSEGSDEEADSVEGVVHADEMPQELEDLVLACGLCNMATIHKTEAGPWQANGDATEVALQVFAHKLERGKPRLTGKAKDTKASSSVGHYQLAVEHPFDSTIKRMSTAWALADGSREPKQCVVYLKGAVERVLDRCTRIGLGEDSIELTDKLKEDIIARMDQLAGEGLRVLALSGKHVHQPPAAVKEIDRDELESELSFLGLAGIFDPPRPQSRGAVLEAAQAGITTRMLTGDHPATATAIAKSVGILSAEFAPSSVMTGHQFDALSEAEIDALPDLPLVIARCAPETKVRMVEALHRRRVYGMKRFCVMTGDGVNDSPALKRADVGIAMGLNGSDVAKSVSDIVLADDNFASITRAIRKGRATLSNLSKFLLYLLSGNVAEVLVMCIGLAFKNEMGVSVYPISPVAALWINTIAAGPPALALGLEPTAKDAMDKSPGAYKTIFTLWWCIDLVFYGILIGALTVLNFCIVVFIRGNGDLGVDCNTGSYNTTCELLYHGRGTTFATLTLMLMIHSLECKHLEKGLFQVDLFDNKLLLWSAFALSLSVFPVVYIPRISDYAFQVLGLTWEWGLVFGMCAVYVVIVELYKMLRRRLGRGADEGGKGLGAADKGLPRFDTVEDRERGV